MVELCRVGSLGASYFGDWSMQFGPAATTRSVVGRGSRDCRYRSAGRRSLYEQNRGQGWGELESAAVKGEAARKQLRWPCLQR